MNQPVNRPQPADTLPSTAIHQAVILAAGLGSRIRGESQPLPKPLVQCGGLPLLKRTLLTAAAEGITRFVMIVGCDGDRVRAAIEPDPDLAHLELIFVDNPDYKLSNGVSVLKARPYINGEFFLMMSDHIVDRAIFRTLQAEPARKGLVLAVDYKLNTIFDMDDATKVKVGPRNTIAHIGKEIPAYDAVDTGVFRVDPVLFEHLQGVFDAQGNTSLSDGVQALSASGKARVADVGDAWWQDVDTPETRVYGEGLLLGMLGRADDGPISRHINRRLSRPITRLLMNTRVRPSHITVLSLLISLAAAGLMAGGVAWAFLAGAALYQIGSVLRGVDGELARLRWQFSERGAWLDTVTDDVSNLAFQVGLGYGIAQATGQPGWFVLSLATAGAGMLLCGALYRAVSALGLGTYRALDWRYRDPGEAGAFQRFCASFAFLAGRDVYSALVVVAAVVGVIGLQVVSVLAAVIVAMVSGQFLSSRLLSAASAAAQATQQPKQAEEPVR